MNQPSRMKLNVVELSERDPGTSFKKAALKALGDLSEVDVLYSEVLVATYVRARITAGGIIVPDNSVHEDRYQGKVGLILKLGFTAFKYDGQFAYEGRKPEVGDYVVFHTSDGREMGIRGVSVKWVPSSLIKGRIPDHMADVVY